MAITKIIALKGRLRDCLNYTSNPEKTYAAVDGSGLENLLEYTRRDVKTGQYRFVAGFHCTAENALQVMQNTKRRWHKDVQSYVQGYHLIQSFMPGEVTPEQCFRIGCEFAERYLADKYECTVSTHLDKGHLHCHIVFNSVSYVDGKMFRNNFQEYYSGIRKVSDELCREHGLSVIETDGQGLKYNVWRAESESKPTIRQTIQTDIEAAMKRTTNWESFVGELRKMGYEVKPSGPNHKYTTVQPRYGKRAIRLASLEAPYQEDAIKLYFAKRRAEFRGAEEPQFRQSLQETTHYYAAYQRWLPQYKRHHISRFLAMYYHYRRLLRRAREGKTPRRYVYLLWDDLQKFDRYQKQCDFIRDYQIETVADATGLKEKAEDQIRQLTRERKQLYYLRDKGSAGYNMESIHAQINDLTERLKQQRQVVTLCGYVEQDAVHIEKQWELVRQMEEEQERKEREQNEQRSRRR